jgi:hypothetical protein
MLQWPILYILNLKLCDSSVSRGMGYGLDGRGSILSRGKNLLFMPFPFMFMPWMEKAHTLDRTTTLIDTWYEIVRWFLTVLLK